jgi:type I restriction enzyme S subunit
VISRSSSNGAFPTKRLGEVVEFLDSRRRPVTESDRRAGPYPYYGANGQQGTIDDYIFDEPLVLLAEDGGHFGDPERGIAYRISGKTWVNNHAHVLRPRSDIDLAYLCRVLENYDVTPFVTGTTRGKLTKAGASEIVIPLPRLAEQRRIAEVLDRAEALRAKRRAALVQLDSLTQSLFLDLFGDPATNPKGWPTKTLGELVAEFRYGSSNKSASQGKPALRIPNVAGGTIDLTDLKLVPVDAAEFERLQLRDGDLLFVRTNGNPDFVGRCAVFDSNAAATSGFEGNEFIFASYLIRARVAANIITPVFLREYLLGAEGRRQLRSRSKTSAGQFNINTESLGAIPVPLPPLPLEREFARRVRAVEKLKTAQRASLAEVDGLFATLQHRAFRGEL